MAPARSQPRLTCPCKRITRAVAAACSIAVVATLAGCACEDDAPGTQALSTGGSAGSSGSSNAGAAGSAGAAGTGTGADTGATAGSAGNGGAAAATSDAAADNTSPDADGEDADTPEAGADTADTGVDLDASDANSEPPVSQFCGDGIRDPLSEECDDGLATVGTTADSCNDQCQVVDIVAAPVPPPNGLPNTSRTLGLGRHPLAAGPAGYAVVLLDVRVTPTVLRISTLDTQGRPLIQGLDFGAHASTHPFEDSVPVVAALPDGSYVAAWTDLAVDKEMRGIALRRITPNPTSNPATSFTTATLGTPIAANTSVDFNQENPDLIWTGSELVVAWVEQGISPSYDVLVRSFSASLAPLTPEQTIANTPQNEIHVALCPFAGSYAIAWRTGNAYDDETLHIRAGTTSWSVGPYLPSNAFDRPSLVAIDDTHLFLFFVADTAPGAQEQARLYGAVLDTAAPGVTPSFAIEQPVPVEGITTTQNQPVAARAGAHLYVAWRELDTPATGYADDLWLKEIPWSRSTLDGAITLDLTKPALPLPPDASLRLASQTIPALAASPSGTSLFIAYSDQSDVQASPEVRLRLNAVPLLWPGGVSE